MRQLIEEYVNSGKVRVGYLHFAFLSEESFTAAEASECAGEQGKFWEYHDALFQALAAREEDIYTTENLTAMAQGVGADAAKFEQCLTSGKHKDFVQEQTAFGQKLGVQSTPSFVVNGIAIIGAQPYENFKQVIESELP